MALGLIAANQGRHQAAVELLEDSLRSPNAPLPESRPDVFVTLGQSYAALGRLQLAVELFARCLADVEESPDSTPAQIRFSIYLSCALADMGEVERAQEVVTDALARSEGFADPIAHVHLNWSVARLASLRGQPGIALEYARRAIALLEASEDTLQLGRAHLLAAGIMNMQGEASRATPHLELAERLLGRRADAGDLASLRAEQAKTFAYVGDADAAIAHAQEALDLLGDDDPAEQGGVWTALARGLELKGETASAEEAFRRGMELLSGQGRWREAEQAARSWSRVLADAGRKDDAAELDERAEEFAARAGAAAEANAAH
jgi:tetratricopeptide (TPR) repeat protein